MTASLTAREVLDSLGRSFSSKAGYLLIREIALGVRDGRRADAIALQLYESRGVHLHGFEVKVSRSDWRRELADAAKADDLVRACRYFSIVAAPGIVDPTELPAGWGLFEVRGRERRLYRVVAATERPDAEALTLVGLGRLLRRAIEGIRAPGAEALEAARAAGVEEGRRLGKGEDDHEAYDRKAHRELQRAVHAFERASGIGIRHWHDEAGGARLGTAVRELLNHPDRVGHVVDGLMRSARELERAAMEITAAAAPSIAADDEAVP